MNLKNLRIGARLGLSFAVTVVLLLVLAAVANSRINAMDTDIALTNEDRYPKTVLVHTVKDELNATARSMRNMLLMEEPQAIQAELSSIEANSRNISAALEKLDQTIHSDKGRALLKELTASRQQFRTLLASFTSLASKPDQHAQAREVLLKDLRPVQLQYMATLDKLLQYQALLMTDSAKETQGEAKTARLTILLLSLAALAASIAVAWLATRSITAPIAEAVSVARRVADGDLTSHIAVESSDETGQLMQALQDMNTALLTIVGKVRTGTDSIATASNQIATGNLDLSSRTEQQASSLEETASSMEEITSTTRHNGDNARQANQLAVSASDVAVKGGTVVAQVVSTMDEINESSRKIVDIISVIDGIAFQTNILALNAAVEAARAGEQGRGFAVVASEVRNLAQRSAAAAKEIKELINTSVDKVESGSRLVAQAGSTMEEIVSSVQRVTDIMGEITEASREQESGIDQINRAITEMDTTTQQNAALVEQAAAAAQALQHQSEELARAVSVFKLNEGAARRPAKLGLAPQSGPGQPRQGQIGAPGGMAGKGRSLTLPGSAR
jgi:methyl-accepting chemotaxis protein